MSEVALYLCGPTGADTGLSTYTDLYHTGS